MENQEGELPGRFTCPDN